MLLAAASIKIATAQNVGIGTAAPTDKLHVNGAAAANAFLVQVNSVNKLRVNANGGTTIGSTAAAPANGLYVAGVTNPVGGIRSAANPITVESNNDSVVILAGQNKVVVAANGGIRIIAANGAGGITIDAGSGNLDLKGNNINITASNNCTIRANKLFATSTDSTYFSTINGNIALYAAKSTDITSVLNLTVNTGLSSALTSGTVTSITTGTNMDISASGTGSISSGGKLTLLTNSSMETLVNSGYVLTAGTTYDVTATGNATIRSFATNKLTGSLVLLNNGGSPAARVGDVTANFTSGSGVITTGSGTVLIGN